MCRTQGASLPEHAAYQKSAAAARGGLGALAWAPWTSPPAGPSYLCLVILLAVTVVANRRRAASVSSGSRRRRRPRGRAAVARGARHHRRGRLDVVVVPRGGRMFATAVATTSRRVGAPRTWPWAAAAMACGVVPVVAIVLATGSVPLTGIAVIPVAGIVIGNTMTVHTLVGRRTFAALREEHGQYEACTVARAHRRARPSTRSSRAGCPRGSCRASTRCARPASSRCPAPSSASCWAAAARCRRRPPRCSSSSRSWRRRRSRPGSQAALIRRRLLLPADLRHRPRLLSSAVPQRRRLTSVTAPGTGASASTRR